TVRSYNIPSTNLEEISSSSWAAKLEDPKRPTSVESRGLRGRPNRGFDYRDNKGLDERLGVPIVEKETMTLEQIVEVQEMVDETIRDHSLYDPQALEYFFKILTDVSQDNNPDGNDEGEDNIVHLPSYIQLNPPLVPSVVPVPKVLPKSRQPRSTVTEVFDAYYDKSAEEPLESIVFGSKEEERETELEVLLQKLVAEYEAATKKEAEEKNNDLPDDCIKVARIGGAEETYPVGPYCEEVGVKKVKEKKEIKIEKEEAGVEKDEEKEVEVKKEEKEETKEEKSEKYEENVPVRIEKIVGETEDEDDDNEANEDNDDNDEMIVDEEDNEKKEDVEELTKKSKDLDY
ncbi:11205_t:CDS:2, partial [Racocetra persica]